MTLERRVAKRHRVDKPGLIIMPGTVTSLEVTIIDINAGGAKLSVSAVYNVPMKFNLLVVGEKRILPSLVVWRVNDRVGIRFSGAEIDLA